MTETTMEEVERLNPQMNWGLRKCKKVIKKRAAKLSVGTYALGCRGHPGIVIERNYWPNWSIQDLFGANVSIKSLVDGIEESCFIFNCAPRSISKEEADRRVEQMKTLNSFDIALVNGYPLDKTVKWLRDWIKRGVLYYVIYEQNSITIKPNQAHTREEAEKEVEDGKKRAEKGTWKNVSGFRIVEVLNYPAPIKSPELHHALLMETAA